MNTDVIRIYTENDVVSTNDCFLQKDDLKVEYTEGKLTVTATDTKIRKIQLEWEAEFSSDAYLLGDAFERSYGELCWKKASDTGKMPWYFVAREGDLVYAYGVETQANSFCHFMYKDGKVVLEADVRSASLPLHLNGRTLHACTVVTKQYSCTPFEAIKRFCTEMCHNPKGCNRPVFGGNDWYCNYGVSSSEKILEHSRRIAECAKGCPHKPYMVIDSGWQLCRVDDFNGGPWIYSNDNFKDMQKLAQDMENVGVIPGLWLRPLKTAENLPEECFSTHPEGGKWFLDPTNPIVLEKIAQSIKTIVEWGYKLIKHDFTTYDTLGYWGFEMTEDVIFENKKFSTDKLTTAEAINNLYRVIREAAGEDVVIIGCNTIGHLGAGVFELQRIGDDTSGFQWETTKKMGINTLAFRLPQHKTFFDIDADCVGIMNKMPSGDLQSEEGTFLVPWQKNRQWLDLVAKSGTPLFVSIGKECFTEEVRNDVSQAFRTMCAENTELEPVDWFETKTPSLWKTKTGKIINYEW